MPPSKTEHKWADWKFSFKAASKQEGSTVGAASTAAFAYGASQRAGKWGYHGIHPKALQDAASITLGLLGTVHCSPVPACLQAQAVTQLMSDGFCLIRQFFFPFLLSFLLPVPLFTVNCSLFSLHLRTILFMILLKRLPSR